MDFPAKVEYAKPLAGFQEAGRNLSGGCFSLALRCSSLVASKAKRLGEETALCNWRCKSNRTGDWSGRAMARSGLRMMPTFPLPSLKFRTAGFPQYGFKAGVSDRACPGDADHALHGLPLSFVLPASLVSSPFCAGGLVRWSTSVRAAAAALPQGPSLRTGFFCPAPSSLNRPHPPHSQAHPLFTAQRLIGDAFAVHTTPRRPPSGSTLSLSFLLDMPPSTTPRRSQPVGSSHAVPTWAFAML